MASKLAVLTLAVVMHGAPAPAAPQNLPEAIAEHRRLAAESPTPGVLNDLANLLVLKGQREEAESIYRRVLSTDAGNSEAQFNLGLLLQSRGETDEAEQLFLAVLARQPRHQWALYQLGAIHESRGERREALGSYAQALALDPELFFADVNPQVVTNRLLTESVLAAARLRGGARLAPMQYSRPREITKMLLGLPQPELAPSEPRAEEEPDSDSG